jgi:hypothetical protein
MKGQANEATVERTITARATKEEGLKESGVYSLYRAMHRTTASNTITYLNGIPSSEKLAGKDWLPSYTV